MKLLLQKYNLLFIGIIKVGNCRIIFFLFFSIQFLFFNMINDDFNLNFNIPNLPDIDDISNPDGNQLQSIPSFSSMNLILNEKGLVNSNENIISPQFKAINFDNCKLKDNNNESLDNICEINKKDKNSIIIEKEKIILMKSILNFLKII